MVQSSNWKTPPTTVCSSYPVWYIPQQSQYQALQFHLVPHPRRAELHAYPGTQYTLAGMVQSYNWETLPIIEGKFLRFGLTCKISCKIWLLRDDLKSRDRGQDVKQSKISRYRVLPAHSIVLQTIMARKGVKTRRATGNKPKNIEQQRKQTATTERPLCQGSYWDTKLPHNCTQATLPRGHRRSWATSIALRAASTRYRMPRYLEQDSKCTTR
jgi:hypothetical protein